MQKYLVEIKARTADHGRIRVLLEARGAEFDGTDHQTDHYFKCPTGRLKLRSGDIERTLIAYRRPDEAGPKVSTVTLATLPDRPTAERVAATLDAALGTWVRVVKCREIYFLDNVKIHLDRVEGLGPFLEIEAIGSDAADHRQLLAQCQDLMRYLGVRETDLVENSYSDMLAARD